MYEDDLEISVCDLDEAEAMLAHWIGDDDVFPLGDGVIARRFLADNPEVDRALAYEAVARARAAFKRGDY